SAEGVLELILVIAPAAHPAAVWKHRRRPGRRHGGRSGGGSAALGGCKDDLRPRGGRATDAGERRRSRAGRGRRLHRARLFFDRRQIVQAVVVVGLRLKARRHGHFIAAFTLGLSAGEFGFPFVAFAAAIAFEGRRIGHGAPACPHKVRWV